MKALIDGDIFCYSHGSATNDEGHPLAWPLVASRISAQIKNIIEASGSDSYQIYLTGKDNFRESVATIRPYKGNRKSEKPYHYERVRTFLEQFRGAIVVDGMEADDRLSIEQMKDLTMPQGGLYQQFYARKWTKENPAWTVICSVDKDLDNTPGWHYNWTKDDVYWVNEMDSLRNFYCQLLTGDSVDNIPGLFGIGKASVHLKNTMEFGGEAEMYSYVRDQYEKRFGSYWVNFLDENAALLWMLREEPSHKYSQYEVYGRFECLEEERLKSLEAA